MRLEPEIIKETKKTFIFLSLHVHAKKIKEEEGEYNSHLVETQLDEQCEKIIPTFGTVSFFSFFFSFFDAYLPTSPSQVLDLCTRNDNGVLCL